MKRSSVLGVVLFGSAGFVLSIIASGCGTSVGGYCDKVCDCVGCTTSERADCVDNVEDAKKQASEKGCGSDFDDFFSCVNSELVCNEDRIEADGCDVEATKVSECGVSAVGLIDACAMYANHLIDKYEECDIDIQGGPHEEGTYECTAAEAKLASCYDGCLDLVDCPCVKDPTGDGCVDKLQPYSDCLVGCND